MAQERADEMVLAGTAPNTSYPGDPIAHIHRGTSFIVLVDGAIIIYLLMTTFTAMGWLNGNAGTAFLGVSVFLGLITYSGYRNRKAWAYWPAVLILALASAMFGFLAFINLMQALLSGYLSGLLFVFLMGWAALGSGRRALFHWHPGYRAGYHQDHSMMSFNLEDGEMLAACPSCLAVLAIRPMMLGRADRCPHCGSGLVSDTLLSRHEEE